MKDLISTIQDNGIKNVSEKTHITEKNLNSILDKDFASLHKTKAMGFIKILQREYDIDFTDWIEDFNKYHNLDANKIEEKKLFSDNDLDRANIKKNSSSLKFFTYIAVIITLIVVGYMVVNNIKYKSADDSKNLTIVKEIVEEAKVELDEIKEANNSELSNIFGTNESDGDIEENETNESVEVNSSLMVSEFNDTFGDESKGEKKVKSTKTKDTEIIEENILLDGKISIVPKSNVWVGIIYLENYKKRNIITKNPIELDSSKDQLIITGHEHLDILVGDEHLKLTSNTNGKLRFLLKNGKIEPISLEEFIELNKGRSW
jgi:cytoskeletal protein RodZ